MSAATTHNTIKKKNVTHKTTADKSKNNERLRWAISDYLERYSPEGRIHNTKTKMTTYFGHKMAANE